MKTMVTLGCVFLASVFLVVSIVAQPLPYSLSGHILDNNSEYVIGADITLLNERTSDTLVLTSTANGEYQQDAYNFAAHYKNCDTIRYNVTYEDIGAVVTADIDISRGGTKLDIVLTIEDSPEMTPNPTPRRSPSTRKSAEMYPDADGDGLSDTKEKLKGSDPNDPCSPNENCAQCIEKRKPKVTPEMFSPIQIQTVTTPIPTPTATPIAPITPTPRQAPAAVTSEPAFKIPGFCAFICIMSFVVIVVMRRRK